MDREGCGTKAVSHRFLSPELNARVLHVEIEIDKVALRQIFLLSFQFSRKIIPSVLQIYL
jgi:hypothetical protein